MMSPSPIGISGPLNQVKTPGRASAIPLAASTHTGKASVPMFSSRVTGERRVGAPAGVRLAADPRWEWAYSRVEGERSSEGTRRTAHSPLLKSEKKIVPLCGWGPQTNGAFGMNPCGSSE